MTLNLAAVSKQVRAMAESLAFRERRTQQLLGEALRQLAESPADFDELRRRAENGRTGWPIARPLAPPSERWPLPAAPAEYTVVATDGSQIEPDRHGPVLCYLINVGSAVISYGARPRAALESEPILGFGDDDLYISYKGGQMLVRGHVLDVRRSILESKTLARKAGECAARGLTVAIQDGTLILRTMEGLGLEEYIREGFLEEFLGCLEELRRRQVPVASYVSRPRSVEVVNLLRLLRCPHPAADCHSYCPELSQRNSQPCAQLAGLLDGAVFQRALLPGQRSAVFLSPSAISLERYELHRVCFFYLNVGREVARVEVPEWVAHKQQYLDEIHAVLYDQCQRGDGYPRVLIEAHEKAVISGAERQQFQNLVEACLASQGIEPGASQKQRSKRLRGL